MKKYWLWFIQIRPLSCSYAFFASLGCWGAGYFTINSLAIITSLECFWVTAATMVMNNYIDRKHDEGKNSEFYLLASKNEHTYLLFTTGCWLTEVIFVVYLFTVNRMLGYVALGRAVVGFTYSWTRHIPCMPLIFIAMFMGSTGASPLANGNPNHVMWVILAGIFFSMLSRECYKDIEDHEIDLGYKKTIATTWGTNNARLIARSSQVFSCLLFLSIPLLRLPIPAAWGGLLCLSMVCLAAFMVVNNIPRSKSLLDTGIGAFIIVLGVCYWLSIIRPAGQMVLSWPFLAMAFMVFLAASYLWPEPIRKFIAQGIDTGKENVGKRQQSWLMWPMMWHIYTFVILACTLICGQIRHGGDPIEALKTSAVATGILLLLVVSKIPHFRTPGRSRGYTIIERHTVGLVIGFFFAAMNMFGLPLEFVAVAIPLVSIINPKMEPLCHLLRSYGCWFGIIVGVAIVYGIDFSLHHIMPAYGIVVAFYFAWRGIKRIGVYIPKNTPIITPLMQLCFVRK